ncbi:MAG TPA: CdaR family protein [Verrucomicrobiota bacterium]|nr:hypothetical protein [Verrucomicrobiales bacterium]HRI13569.1 CdaR family protein [Verrucomicrobiota bacterium]
MNWRSLILEHRGQKLFALGLAVLIWLTVRSTEGIRIGDGSTDGRQVFPNVPIVVLTSAADLGRYAVSPEFVNVELSGDPDVLRRVSAQSVEAYVNLVDLGSTPQMIAIHANPPDGTTLVALDPTRVRVDRIVETNSPSLSP